MTYNENTDSSNTVQKAN